VKSTFVCAATAGLSAFILATTASPAHAQASRLGGTVIVRPFDGQTVRYPAVAYDGANDAFLVVYGLQKHGARFVSTDGVPLGQPTRLSTVDGGATRVACGADVNACLVAWIQEPGAIMGRLVRYNAGNVQLLSAAFVITDGGLGAKKLTSSPPSVAYSTTSHEFLVAWTDTTVNVTAQRVSGAGVLLGAAIPIAVTAAWEGFPSIAYNSARDEFTVSYYLETVGVPSGVGITRVQPGTGAVLGGNVLYASVFEQYPDFAYNTRADQFLAVTWGFAGNKWMLHGQLADGGGQPIGGILPLALNGGGDGIGVAYSPVSNNYLAVYVHHDSPEIFGVTVNSAGVPGVPFQVTVSGTKLATKPQVAASKTSARFLAVASENFGQAMAQLLQDAPAAPPSQPAMSVDTLQPGNIVNGQNFFVAGWAIDRGAPQGTGIDQVHVWVFPLSGATPSFLGAATYGIPRADVAAAYGDARFTNSGYGLLASITTPGVYDVMVFARSTVTQAFTAVQTVRVMVSASIPLLYIDTPTQNATVSGSSITIAGWAADFASQDSAGVDAVHVWAYPVAGGPPQFFAGAWTGGFRPDVGVALGAARFAASGFTAVGTLPAGDWDLAVYAHSSFANAFNNVRVVRVHVQ
jgi:hypothetical protein